MADLVWTVSFGRSCRVEAVTLGPVWGLCLFIGPQPSPWGGGELAQHSSCVLVVVSKIRLSP